MNDEVRACNCALWVMSHGSHEDLVMHAPSFVPEAKIKQPLNTHAGAAKKGFVAMVALSCGGTRRL